MDLGSPDGVKKFPGLYNTELSVDSDSDARASKQLIGKRKDKKEKDISYAALGESSADEEDESKSPLRAKKNNPFKFSKKEKKDKERPKDSKDKESKSKHCKEKEVKVTELKNKSKDEPPAEEKLKVKEQEESLKVKSTEESSKNKIDDSESVKDEKHKEGSKEKGKEDKLKEEKSKDKNKDGKVKVKKSSRESKKEKSSKKDALKTKERKKVEQTVSVVEELPVFGVSLSVAVERNTSHDGVQLPAVVRHCIDYIEETGVSCEGIYRLSGVKSKIQQLKRAYNCRESVCLYDHEPHTVACLLKLFLRELPEPVLTAELLPQFEAAAALKDPEQRVEQLTSLLEQLPVSNRLLVQYMFKHMEHVIQQEKVNKMNVQNVSLVLSPTMQISHRVLNAFFMYGKIFFSGVTIRKYVPPLVGGELPDTPAGIQEEIEKQESLLSQLHRELKAGSSSRQREEQLWEAQRILTQLKRKQRVLGKRVPSGGGTPSAAPALQSESTPPSDPQSAVLNHRRQRTVQIINEDNVTVIQIGDQPASSSTQNDVDPADAPTAAKGAPAVVVEDGEGALEKDSAVAVDAVEAEEAMKQVSEHMGSDLAAAETEQKVQQLSFSDLRRFSGPAQDSGDAAIGVADPAWGPEHGDGSSTQQQLEDEAEDVSQLLREAVLLKLEEEELLSTGRELRSRLAAERTEIGRLNETVREMETLYKYRTYSMDSSDDTSGGESEESDADEDLHKQLLEIVGRNEDMEAQNSQLERAIHMERRSCQRLRAQIRYMEFTQTT